MTLKEMEKEISRLRDELDLEYNKYIYFELQTMIELRNFTRDKKDKDLQ